MLKQYTVCSARCNPPDIYSQFPGHQFLNIIMSYLSFWFARAESIDGHSVPEFIEVEKGWLTGFKS